MHKKGKKKEIFSPFFLELSDSSKAWKSIMEALEDSDLDLDPNESLFKEYRSAALIVSNTKRQI
jgi:hypothetical protein